jgi:hypothetical protein
MLIQRGFASDRLDGWLGWLSGRVWVGACSRLMGTVAEEVDVAGPDAVGSVPAPVVTAAEVMAGHVSLDISCLDRLYLTGFVPGLQTPGGVVYFLHDHRGNPIASPALFERIGGKFRDAVRSWAEAGGIPMIRFKADDRKAEVMAPYLDAARAAGRSQVVAVGCAQEFAPARGRDQARDRPRQVPAVLLRQGAAAGVDVLLLHLGHRDGAGVHQGLHLLPLHHQSVAQPA